MALLQYLKPVNSVLHVDPRSSLAMKVAPRKIAETDVLVQIMCRKKLVWVQTGGLAMLFMSQLLSIYSYQKRAATAAR